MEGEQAARESPLIGIVILNWNGWRDTIEAVTSTRNLTYKNYRVYVVDNASMDDSEKVLREWDPDLAIVQAHANLGWAGGNNVGIRAALGDGCTHVFLLNNDATVRPDTLDRLEAAAQRTDVAGLGCVVMSAPNPGWVEFAGSYVEPRTTMPKQRHCRVEELGFPTDLVPMVAVKGCGMLLTQQGLRTTGLLTEDYFLNFDETDWCYRARNLGLDIYLVPGAFIDHKGAASFNGTGGPLYRYFVTRNRLVFAFRHLGRTGRWHAWRSAGWELKHALMAAREDRSIGRLVFRRAIIFSAIAIGVVDYVFNRLGDCPALVRRLQQSYG